MSPPYFIHVNVVSWTTTEGIKLDRNFTDSTRICQKVEKISPHVGAPQLGRSLQQKHNLMSLKFGLSTSDLVFCQFFVFYTVTELFLQSLNV